MHTASIREAVDLDCQVVKVKDKDEETIEMKRSRCSCDW